MKRILFALLFPLAMLAVIGIAMLVSSTERTGTTSSTIETAPPSSGAGIDICPNLDGIQLTMPEGKMMSGGQCIEPPSPNLLSDSTKTATDWMYNYRLYILIATVVAGVLIFADLSAWTVVFAAAAILLNGALWKGDFLATAGRIGFPTQWPADWTLPVLGNPFPALIVAVAIATTAGMFVAARRKKLGQSLAFLILTVVFWGWAGPILSTSGMGQWGAEYINRLTAETYTPSTTDWSGDSSPAPVSSHYPVPCGTVSDLTLDSVPWDLTESGRCGGELHILDSGCVDIYNARGRLLVTDHRGEFHDLRGLGGALYASCDGRPVSVTFASR